MKVRLDDGAELFYRVDDFTDPWTHPETVVLHHGMAKNHKLWYAWVPIIARHYRVVRYDMRGMGQSSVPQPGYSWTLDNYAKDLLGVLDKLELDRVHLIGETVGGTISMKFATLHQERLRSLTVCTSPTHFPSDDGGRAHNARQFISRRLDPQIVDPAYTHWYAGQMAATAAHVVDAFSRYAPGVDLRPALKNVRTPTLVLATSNLQGEEVGDSRNAANFVSNGKLVVFPGVSGFVQHILPVPCARVWLDFAKGLE